MKPGSKAWKKFMAKLYGIGAAIVIIGALFKIEHWAGASYLLITGLLTEAIIFFFSAFEPPHEEPDWSLVYPELAMGDADKKALKASNSGKLNKSGSLTEQLDNMLTEAKVEPELIASLGDGMRTFSTQAKQLADISSAADATQEYSSTLRGAAEKVSTLSDKYREASETLTGFTSHQKDGESAGHHLQRMSENLSSLNNMYELQLTELEKSRALFTDMSVLMKNLSESVEDTKQYKESISELAKNLKTLNTVYSNMLNAMGSGRA
ncbi:MAG: gliding motility protein GldL [Flavobacteriales bacterium]|nr:gliding motility protein GldL [Flavobacteriales bacterium]